jgi:hypothetical protein
LHDIFEHGIFEQDHLDGLIWCWITLLRGGLHPTHILIFLQRDGKQECGDEYFINQVCKVVIVSQTKEKTLLICLFFIIIFLELRSEV